MDSDYFYLDTDGRMSIGWLSDNEGNKYYVDTSNGKVSADWKQIDDSQYYLNNNEHMITEWIQLDGKYYYLDPANKGKVTVGTTATINGVQYNLDSSDMCQSTNGVLIQTPGTTNSNSGSFGGDSRPGVFGFSGPGISSGTPDGPGNSSDGPTSGNSDNSPPGLSVAPEPGRIDGPG